MSDVDGPWMKTVTVQDMTDRDLEAARSASIGVTYDGESVPQLVEAVRQATGLETYSAVCDRALRVELAAAIDNDDLSVTRSDYDIKTTIPPRGWVDANTPLDCDDPATQRVDDVPHPIFTSTPSVVDALADEAVAEGYADSKRSLIVVGLERLSGHSE
jgi:hypothetical protein